MPGYGLKRLICMNLHQNEMKRKDLFFILFLISLFLPFFLFSALYDFYLKFNSEHGFLAAFVKFAVLATAGELAGLRIRSGNYFSRGFGIFPRALVWGILGIFIKTCIYDLLCRGTAGSRLYRYG